MSAFYVWNPYMPENSNIVECVVTNGDIPDGIACDRNFIMALLQELQIEEQPENWTITRCRSKYYSEDPDSPDWRDIWQTVWKVNITTSDIIKLKRQKKAVIPWREADITGDEWIREIPDKVMCLAVSDCKNQASLENAKQAIIDDAKIKEMQKEMSLKEPAFGYTKVLNKYYQLQILLGEFDDAFYAQGAEYAERILELCKEHGGTLNFSERRR